MKNVFCLMLLSGLTLLMPPVYAADPLSPVGLWKTIDDNSGKPAGLVRIALVDGQYQAKLKKFSLNLAKISIRNVASAKDRAIINL
jgi:hypothetical protein